MLKRLIDAICFRLINGPLGAPSLRFEISRLDVKPGDFLVARFRKPLSATQVAHMRAAMEGVLPGIKVLVFEGEVDLSVLTHQADRSPIAA